MLEPPDGAWVVVGDDPSVLLVRDDRSARGQGHPAGQRWWLAHDGTVAPVSWAEVTGPPTAYLDADRSIIQRVYTQAQLDDAVAQARRDAGLSFVGDHVVEPGGYCRTHGSHHNPEELARADDRAEGDES
jgi:hypothetical protein